MKLPFYGNRPSQEIATMLRVKSRSDSFTKEEKEWLRLAAEAIEYMDDEIKRLHSQIYHEDR